MVKTPKYPTSREEALKTKSIYYFTGLFCENGHLDKRFTCGKNCVSCSREGRAKRKAAMFDTKDIARRKKMYLQGLAVKAKARGLECTITEDDVVWNTHCPVYGFELDYFKEGKEDNTFSIDRIDSNKGYVPGNVEVASWRYNDLKWDGTLWEFEQVLGYMRDPKEPVMSECIPFDNQYVKMKKSHIKGGIVFRSKGQEIFTAEEFYALPFPGICPVLGMPMKFNDKGRMPDSFSIDRFDNNKGYVVGNMRVISLRANSLKSNASLSEMEKLVTHLQKKVLN